MYIYKYIALDVMGYTLAKMGDAVDYTRQVWIAV
jgi:hypothetical protein